MANIYNAALMEHNTHPDYKYELEHYTHSQDGINPSCGDELNLKLIIDNGIIKEAAYTGHGCAVSQASADIMAQLIEGKSVAEAQHTLDLFVRMIQGEELNLEEQELLDEAFELQGISKMPARVKCAELAWRTLEHILNEL